MYIGHYLLLGELRGETRKSCEFGRWRMASGVFSLESESEDFSAAILVA